MAMESEAGKTERELTLKEKMKEVNPLVLVLVLCFAFSSWIDLLGVWVELPILVHVLPEGWSFPSYIIVLIQMAMITPVVYTLANRICPGNLHRREIIMAYIIMGVGFTALLLLTVFWNYTLFIAGAERSIAAILLIFFLAMVDTTSCVVYLPYMSRFKEHYIPAYIAGEETGGFITGLMGLIQGAGGEAQCSNETTYIFNETTGENYTDTILRMTTNEPRFSVTGFFIFLAFVMGVSVVSFSLLNFSSFAKKEMVTEKAYVKVPTKEVNGLMPDHVDAGDECSAENKMNPSLNATTILVTKHTEEVKGSDEEEEHNIIAIEPNPDKDMKIPRWKLFICLACYVWAAFLVWGIFPSVQSFSCLPYGSLTYNLAVRIGCCVNPLAAFASFFYCLRSIWKILILVLLSSSMVAYHVLLAATSPSPPLQDQTIGAVLAAGTSIALMAIFAYARTCIASILRREGGHQALYYAGAAVQVGCFTGGITGFILVNVLKLFESMPPAACV